MWLEIYIHIVGLLHLLAQIVERFRRNLMAILVHMPSDGVSSLEEDVKLKRLSA